MPGFARANEHPASAPGFQPAFALQLRYPALVVLGCSLNRRASSRVLGKRCPGARSPDPQNNLGDKLFADTDFAGAVEPELHFE